MSNRPAIFPTVKCGTCGTPYVLYYDQPKYYGFGFQWEAVVKFRAECYCVPLNPSVDFKGTEHFTVEFERCPPGRFPVAGIVVGDGASDQTGLSK